MEKQTFTGITPVGSPWSGGYHQTKFNIILSSEGMIALVPAQGSRTPDFWDAWHAFHDFISENLGMDIPKSTPKQLRKIRNCMGVTYLGVNDHFIGRSADGKFSMRGEDAIPLEDLRVLLSPLKFFLEGEA